MKTIDYTTFRNKSGSFFNEVEAGETLIITRHGNPIARIIPEQNVKIPIWKRMKPKVRANILNLDEIVRSERDDSRY